MEHVTELAGILQPHLGWNKARITFLARFLLALLQLGTVRLTRLAVALNGAAQQESNYRRIQRFFSGFEIDPDAIARLVLFLAPRERVLLILDRTQWQLGQQDLNILVLAVAYRGMAFPVVWTVLPSRGGSTTEQRMMLLCAVLRILPAERIEALLADREFIGKQWLAFLQQRKIPFIIRIKGNLRITSRRGCIRPAASFFTWLPLEQSQILPGRRNLCGQRLYVAGKRILGRNKKPELLLVITSGDPQRALETYARRWEIETLFGALKSRGFDLEATHLCHPERLEKLLACLALAAIWAHHVGEWVHHVVQPIKVKKHKRRAKSFFRLGLDHLGAILFHRQERAAALEICFDLLRHPRFLSCT